MRNYDANKVAKRVRRSHMSQAIQPRVRHVKANEYKYRVGPGDQFVRVLVSPHFITVQDLNTGMKFRVNVAKL
jgi:hypothetical protein